MNENFKGAVKFLAAFFLAIVFFSCTSVPKFQDISTLDVLDGQSDFFIYCPVKGHETFFKTALKKFSPDINDKTALQIINRTETVAVAAGNKIQIAAKGKYPDFALKNVFQEKKGWEKKNFSGTNGNYDYFISKNPQSANLEAAFPGNFVMFGNDVENQVAAFDLLSFENTRTVPPLNYNEEVYDFLSKGENNDIIFYAQNPLFAIKAIFGKNISFGIKAIKGKLYEYNVDTKKDRFGAEILIELNDKRTMKAALSIIKIAMFPQAARISQSDDTHIKIQDITIEHKALLNFF